MSKVLQLTSNYADKFYIEFFASLKEGNIDSTVFVPQKIGFDDCPDASKEIIKSACYTKLDRFFLRKKTKKIFEAIKKEVNVKEFDMIHAHSLYTCGIPALYLYKEYGIPYIVSVRENDATFFPKAHPFAKKLIHEVFKHASSIVFITPCIKKKAEKHFSFIKDPDIDQKCHVIPNKVSDVFLKEDRAFKKKPEGNINILFVARLVKDKRLGDLAKFCSKCFKEGDKLSIITPTENPPAKLMEKYPFIEFVGEIPHFELAEYYKKADIFALLAIRETFGISYVEAMSQGTPIIYSKNDGIDGFFLEGEVGYPVRKGSYKDFLKGLKLILDNYENMSKKCIEVSNNFSTKKVMGAIFDLYKNAMK